MKINKFLLILSILSFYSVNAIAGLGPRLYIVEKEGQTSYLFGTIHTGVNFSELPPSVQSAAKESDTLVIETDLKGADPLMREAFPMGEVNSLKYLLSEKEWNILFNKLSPFFKGHESIVGRFHPTMALMFFNSMTFKETAEPIDRTLEALASNNKKETLYFESVESQIELVKQIFTLDSLKETLNLDPEVTNNSTKELVKLYLDGNLDELNNFMTDELGKNYEIVVTKRNIAWSKKFDSVFAHPGKEFVAVGAGHLGGEFGLINLLRSQGYNINPL